MPKAEIHLHFEGTVGAKAILRMGRKYGVDEIRTRSDAEWLLYFDHPQMFFQNFLFVSSLLRSEEDFFEAALELGTRFAEENIRYAEITIAPQKFMRAGVPYPRMLEAIDAGLREAPQSARRDYRYIIDIVRDLGPEIGMETMRAVEKHPHERVAGIGLGGGENYPAELSKEVFEFAAALGLRKTAHAGEGCGPLSVWSAIRSLGVERIDHGVRSREDPKLVDYLAARQMPLNLCLTSNLMLGVTPSLWEHPLRYYHERGIPVNLSTDDPAFFKTTLSQELELAVIHRQIELEQIPEFMQNALRASFLPEAEKRAFLTEFVSETEALRQAQPLRAES
ncbi:MAG: adenosine deaminase [Candidatus Omnitrophota bacterium]